MIILRQNIYSSKRRNDGESEEEIKSNKKSKRRGRLATAGAIGVSLGGGIVSAKEVLKRGDLDDTVFGGEKTADEIREKFRIKKKVYTPEDSKLFEKLSNKAKNIGIKIDRSSKENPAYWSKDDRISGLESKRGADTLSHEMGHRYYLKDKNAGKIAKISHKIYDKVCNIKRPVEGAILNGYLIPNISGASAGVISGIKKAKEEDKGEKESIVNKHVSWAAPIIASSPMLISEAAASRKGIKYLKEAGASKKYLKDSKRHLGICFGNYATKVLTGSGIGLASREAAYRAEKRRLKKKHKKEQEDKNKEENK